MKRLFSIIFLFITVGLIFMSFSFFKSTPRYYCEIAKEIRSKVGKTLAKRHKMDLIGLGGGMMGSVYMIELGFQIDHPIDHNEARLLIVDCVEELLRAVNENEEVRPFLKNYPFTTENVKIAIFIHSSIKSEVLHPNLCGVSVFQSDQITFYTTEADSLVYKTKVKEPYQEALSRLKKNCKIQ